MALSKTGPGMKRAILISCYYPPDGGAGAQRPRKLAQHARQYGWDLTVVTREPPASRSSWEPEDESLVSSDEHERVVRVPMDMNSTAGAMVPGPTGAEDPFLVEVIQSVRSQLQNQKTDAVILTMPPYGMSPVVPAIKAFSSVPIFVDLQDPWALDGACSYSNKAHWAETNQWMQKVLGMADGVIANTPEARKQLIGAVDRLSSEHVAVVNNGCTVKEFEGALPPRPDAMDVGMLHMVHTGTLHSHAFERTRGLIGQVRKLRNYRAEKIQIGGRTAYYLLQAIELLSKTEPELMRDFRLTLVGVEDEPTRRIVERSACSEQVQLTGFVPYQHSVAWIRHADALFVPLFGLPKGHRSRIIPSKTYEYLASGRPILGALPAGDARELVERSGRGHCADPCDALALSKALRNVIHQARGMGPKAPPIKPFVRDYDWAPLCNRFFNFLTKRVELMA